MPRELRYAVNFVGYSAVVFAKKYARDVDPRRWPANPHPPRAYPLPSRPKSASQLHPRHAISAKMVPSVPGEHVYAELDFVIGGVCMHADGGFVVVPKRIDLKPFLESLPKLATELEEALLRQRNRELSQQTTGVAERGAVDDMVRVSCGPNTVSVAPGTVINRFIRQLTKRFIEIELLLEQAEEIGLRIERQPYSEHLDYIAKTGICRVEGHGVALFVEGRLIFYPSYKVGLVKQQGSNLHFLGLE